MLPVQNLKRKKLKTHNCQTIPPKLAQISSENPYYENVKYFQRKNELKECSTTSFENHEDSLLDLHAFLTNLMSSVESELKYQLFERKYLKCIFTLEAIVLNNEKNELCTLYLDSNTLLIFSENAIIRYIEKIFMEMINQYSKLQMEWNLSKIIKLDIFSIEFCPV